MADSWASFAHFGPSDELLDLITGKVSNQGAEKTGKGNEPDPEAEEDSESGPHKEIAELPEQFNELVYSDNLMDVLVRRQAFKRSTKHRFVI